MSSKPCLLLTLFHIYRQSNCLTTYCSQNEGQTCKFNCTTEQTMDWCSYGILICRDNEACIITCDGYQKCQNTQITCPANADCKLKCISGGNVCEDIAITTNNATSFQCVGSECPSNIPAQYSPNPTRNPTLGPTPYPSKSPTVPTTSPTTAAPTPSPTPFPTQSTPNPTKFPYKPPTYNPSKSPTYIPSTSPSTEPTDFPSKSPTNTPTIHPTKSPTYNPTKSPITPSPTLVIPVTPSPVNPDIISTTITASTTAVPVPHKSDDIAEEVLAQQEIIVIVLIVIVLLCAVILVFLLMIFRRKYKKNKTVQDYNGAPYVQLMDIDNEESGVTRYCIEDREAEKQNNGHRTKYKLFDSFDVYNTLSVVETAPMITLRGTMDETQAENGGGDNSDDDIYNYSSPTPQNPPKQVVTEGEMDTNGIDIDITDKGDGESIGDNDSDNGVVKDMLTPR